MDKFVFFSWYYHLIKETKPEDLDQFLECGINLPMSPMFKHDDPEDVERLKELLDYAQERGVQMILFSDFTTEGYREMGEEKWCAEFKKFYEETLERHPAVYGFFVGDEPSDAYWLDLTKKVIILMTKLLPELKPYINFTGGMGPGFGPDKFGGMDIVEWLRDLKEQSGEFLHTYDMYSQVINNEGGTTDYFKCCKMNAEASEAAGITPVACLICSAHMVFRPVQPLYGINWQVSTAAACGFKGVNWFRLCDRTVDPNYHASPIDAFGNKTALFYDVLNSQKMFSLHYGEIFMHLKRCGTFFFGEDKKRGVYPRLDENSHEIIKNIKAGWEESLVSFFKHDETGEDYFAIVNLSRQHYDHYEFFCDSEKYAVNHVLMNGERQIPVPVGDANADFEGHFLYPGQLGLFRIIKK